MKIPKKHAVAVAKFIDDFLFEGYQPLNDEEADTIKAILSFGVYHKMMDPVSLGKFVDLRIGKFGATARLALDAEDVEFILDASQEVYNNAEMESSFKSALRYLRKEFIRA